MTARTVLAIDPGPTQSAYALIDATTRRPIRFGKIPNAALRYNLTTRTITADVAAIEMVASYGMAVGAEVFDTCVWIGRYAAAIETTGTTPTLEYRRTVKLHHCGNNTAKDSNITQALIDRFAYGQPNRGKGTKANPGWFHGFAADVWQAYALAVVIADQLDTDSGAA